jgi:tetratricopeptide (TPR) repeat protein
MSIEQSLVELFGTGALSLTASLGGRGRAGILPEDGDAFVRFLVAAGPLTNPSGALAHFAREVKSEVAASHIDLDDIDRLSKRLATLVGDYPISPVMAREALQHQRLHGGRRNGAEPPATRLAENIVARAEAEGTLDRLGVDAFPAASVLEGLFRALLSSGSLLEAAVAISAPYREPPQAETVPADLASASENLKDDSIFGSDQPTETETAAVPPESPTDRLPGELRQIIERIAAQTGAPAALLTALLEQFAARDFPRERLELGLTQKAQAYRDLRTEQERPLEADVTVQRLRAEALACLSEGRIGEAEYALSGALSKAMMDGLSRSSGTAAQIQFLQGRIAELRLGYREAADRYQSAANDPAVAGDAIRRWSLLLRQAAALQSEANELGDHQALEQAVLVLASALEAVPQSTYPRNWATTQKVLGDALLALGSAERNLVQLAAAADCYKNARNAVDRAGAPVEWARLEAALGLVHLRKCDVEQARSNAELAIEAFKGALTVFRRDTTPGDWAMAEVNLAQAYSRLSAHEESTRALTSAVEAYRRVLIDYPRGAEPAEYARLQSNLGNVLAELGERTKDARWLDLAVTAYREALAVWRRETEPLKWALGNANLGNALWALGELGGDAGLLQEAADCIVQSLDVFRKLGERQYEQTALDNLRSLHEDLKRMAGKAASYA